MLVIDTSGFMTREIPPLTEIPNRMVNPEDTVRHSSKQQPKAKKKKTEKKAAPTITVKLSEAPSKFFEPGIWRKIVAHNTADGRKFDLFDVFPDSARIVSADQYPDPAEYERLRKAQQLIREPTSKFVQDLKNGRLHASGVIFGSSEFTDIDPKLWDELKPQFPIGEVWGVSLRIQRVEITGPTFEKKQQMVECAAWLRQFHPKSLEKATRYEESISLFPLLTTRDFNKAYSVAYGLERGAIPDNWELPPLPKGWELPTKS